MHKVFLIHTLKIAGICFFFADPLHFIKAVRNARVDCNLWGSVNIMHINFARFNL